jgi:hypothetical protein
MVHVSPEVAWEHFGEKALVFLAGQDRFITVNNSAASLMELILATFKHKGFTGQNLASLLVRHYRLTKANGRRKARALLEQWLAEGFLLEDRGPADKGGSS